MIKEIFVKTFKQLLDEAHASGTYNHIDPCFVEYPGSRWYDERHLRGDTKHVGQFRLYFNFFYNALITGAKDDLISALKEIIETYDFNHHIQIRYLIFFCTSLPMDITKVVSDYFWDAIFSAKNKSLCNYAIIGTNRIDSVAHDYLHMFDGKRKRDMFFFLINNTKVKKNRFPKVNLSPTQEDFAKLMRASPPRFMEEDKKFSTEKSISIFIIGCFNYSDDYYLKFFKKYFSEEDIDVLNHYIELYLKRSDYIPSELLSAQKLGKTTHDVIESGIVNFVERSPKKAIDDFPRELKKVMMLSDRAYNTVVAAFLDAVESMDLYRVGWNEKEYIQNMKKKDILKVVSIVMRKLGGIKELEAYANQHKDFIPNWALERYTALK